MVFKCQEDSFLKQFSSKVVSSAPASLDWLPPGEIEAKELRGWNVICENTILFPEGGGQPCDYGTLDGKPVRNVTRCGSNAVHFVETPVDFEEGIEVKQILDWDRRFDHMQQHSGQHLITALFDREFKYGTSSWWLGTETSHIQLETTHLITRESLDFIERKANDLIRDGCPVSVLMVDPKEAVEFQDIRAPRGLPKDHVGLARVVRIEGIESNMCCGTHVTDLSQLQCVKLLNAEKTKSNILIHFVVGHRVMRKLGECFDREQQVTLAVKGGPIQHVNLIQKLQNNCKASRKTFTKLLKDFAISEAEKLQSMSTTRPKFYALHRQDGMEMEFINTFLRNAPEGIFYFLTATEVGGKGLLSLRGEASVVQKLGPLLIEILDGKGNGKDTSFQGKFNNIRKIPECEALLEEHFKAKSTD